MTKAQSGWWPGPRAGMIEMPPGAGAIVGMSGAGDGILMVDCQYAVVWVSIEKHAICKIQMLDSAKWELPGGA